MIGTFYNVCMIIIGSIVGSVLRKGIKEKYRILLFDAMGLAAAGVGINAIANNMPKSEYPVLFIVSLAVGSLIGGMLDIDGKFQNLTAKTGDESLGKGLSTGILIYCIGTLSILGPIQSAIYGDHTYLFTNGTLDLVTSMVLASTYGIGMILAGPVLLLWQGSIYMGASFLQSFLTDDLMTEISIVGGFLITCSGLSILNIKEFKTMNLLPSLIVPVIFIALKMLFL
jgi:transport protein